MHRNLNHYFEWDVDSWSRAMKLWERGLNLAGDPKNALEIGGRRGGLSFFLAKEHEMDVVCSDLNNPCNYARPLHETFQVADKISYAAVDCTKIPYDDDTFDVVVFKSVIGALGDLEKQKLAINEMYRVLKTGGVLLFAENLQATKIHMLLRKKLVRWSSYWRYLHIKDTSSFLSPFRVKEHRSTGFIAIFLPDGILRKVAAFTDKILCPILPSSFHYIVYGYGIK
ncbi:Methyltransferase domain-containing protein [Chitinophaga eiseniae]|uniref:Methyltransferase domain-containing protein n=1 Tax=Chitinophaga eiseniae TaxID=634771 RepID=A0A1T4RWN4_9BACT|nr:class I SAM-dependent methyltransferase [Chitinophaga eiseniae]SKA20419.1 Methyltransferase domain-containing protein [Chitinophaga eiseniae]